MSSFYGATGAVIENQDGEILLVQEGKDHIEGKWDFPGGGWEDQESIIECVKREVFEETGYKVKINGFLGVYKELNQRDGTETIAFMFSAKPIEKKNEGPKDDEEITDTKFFKPEEMEELEFRHSNRKTMLDKYRNNEAKDLDLLWNKLNLLE